MSKKFFALTLALVALVFALLPYLVYVHVPDSAPCWHGPQAVYTLALGVGCWVVAWLYGGWAHTLWVATTYTCRKVTVPVDTRLGADESARKAQPYWELDFIKGSQADGGNVWVVRYRSHHGVSHLGKSAEAALRHHAELASWGVGAYVECYYG